MDVSRVFRVVPAPQMWPAYGQLEYRVNSFIGRYLTRTNPDSFLYEMRQRFVSTPNLAGYFLGTNEAGNQDVAHLVSYIVEGHGSPYIFIHQAEVDAGWDLGKMAKSVLEEIDRWAYELNKLIPPGNPRISHIEMATWRDADAWVAYFKRMGRGSGKVRSIIEIELGSPVPALVV